MLNSLLDFLEEWFGPIILIGAVLLVVGIISFMINMTVGSGSVTYYENGEKVTVQGTIHRNGHNVTVIEKDGTTRVIYVPCTIKYDE